MRIKSILGLAAMGLALISCQPNSFQINGYALKLQEGDTVCLVDDAQPDRLLASALISQGRFTICGQTDSISLCRIFAASQPDNGTTLFIEPGDLSVELNPAPATSRVSGSRINNEWQQLSDSIQLLGKELLRHASAPAGNDLAIHRARLLAIDSLHRRMAACIQNTARRNSQNALGQYILENYKEPEFK